MMNRRYLTAGIILALAVIVLVAGCGSNQAVDSDRTAIKAGCKDIFKRVKVGDYEVLYRNEFPYLREEAELDEYLAHGVFAGLSFDTLVAMQIDSVGFSNDTGIAYLQMEYVLADSTLSVNPIRFRWLQIDGRWINPKLSRHDKQLEYEEEVRIYWEAVEAMNREKEAGADSGQ